jgi:repressor LexA
MGPASSSSGVKRVPLVGSIAAGAPLQAVEDIEDVLPLPASLIGEGTFFALRVKGDSMTGAGIEDGDLVVIRKQDDATPGSIVAALLEDEATVKTLIRDGARTVLRAENPAYAPIEVTAENSRILGKVVALLRSL